MKATKVWAVYFSATGTTKKVALAVADLMAEKLGVQRMEFDFSLPQARSEGVHFNSGDLVVFGTPVYAGRVPNVLLKYLATVRGDGALAVPVVLYGNRNFDDALVELRDILEDGGFHTVAAAAFVGEHSFSTTLAKGRPDDADMALVRRFAVTAAEKVMRLEDPAEVGPIEVEGTPKPYSGYYQPRDRAGNPVDIRKVKPLTSEACTGCGLCAEICPMGSIDPADVHNYTGICIKCCACIKRCPVGAKYYDDPGYLYHKTELEEGLTRRAEPRLFV